MVEISISFVRKARRKEPSTHSEEGGGEEQHGEICNLLHCCAIFDGRLRKELHTPTILDRDRAEHLKPTDVG